MWASIEDHVTRAEAERAVELAAAETVKTLSALAPAERDRAVWCWSGGKDSQALRVVMEAAGVRRSLLGTIPHLEWRAYLAWCDKNQPDGLVTEANNDLDCRWLAANQRHLFPADSRGGYFWTIAGTRRAQRRYQARFDPPVQIHGRRVADGNIIRSALGPGLDPGAGGAVVYCPVRDWPHELALAVVHYFGMGMCPVYFWPHGWTAGTGSWPGRTPAHGGDWATTWAIEPARVEEAAMWITSARRFLAELGSQRRAKLAQLDGKI